MTRVSLAAVLVLAVADIGNADDYHHGRVRYVEDGTTVQRAAEPSAEEAEANLPFLPGDRVWTDDRGRVEFEFDRGAFLRLDSATKLDYLDNPGQRVVVRLWSGGVYIHQASDGIAFEVETPGGVITTRGRGVYRIDARSGETVLSVLEGEASMGGRGARVREGERVYARDGEVVRGPMTFDRQESDDFTLWVDQRQDGVRYARERPSDLPTEVATYYDELYEYGSWGREPMVGYVWRPRVALGWQPYAQGRWAWTPFGWTWVAYEPWGWAPSHYGRWGYSAAGWYWVPDRNWGPAWVSWAVGGPYVGWCPLGFRNQPIVVYERTHRGGHAIPRAGAGSWVYARHGDMTARDLARRRVQQIDPTELAQVRVVASPRARLTKDLRVVESPVTGGSGAVRNVRTKPTIGDTVPELRTDNQSLVPPPMARRRRDAEDRYDRGRSFGEAAGHRDPDRAETARPRTPEAAPADARPAVVGTGDAGRARERRPQSDAAPVGETRPEAAPAGRTRFRGPDEGARPRGESAGGDDGSAPRREYAAPRRERSDDGEREGGGSSAPRGDSARPRESAPRHEGGAPPATKAPPAREAAPATKEPSSSGGAARRRG